MIWSGWRPASIYHKSEVHIMSRSQAMMSVRSMPAHNLYTRPFESSMLAEIHISASFISISWHTGASSFCSWKKRMKMSQVKPLHRFKTAPENLRNNTRRQPPQTRDHKVRPEHVHTHTRTHIYTLRSRILKVSGSRPKGAVLNDCCHRQTNGVDSHIVTCDAWKETQRVMSPFMPPSECLFSLPHKDKIWERSGVNMSGSNHVRSMRRLPVDDKRRL